MNKLLGFVLQLVFISTVIVPIDVEAQPRYGYIDLGFVLEANGRALAVNNFNHVAVARDGGGSLIDLNFNVLNINNFSPRSISDSILVAGVLSGAPAVWTHASGELSRLPTPEDRGAALSINFFGQAVGYHSDALDRRRLAAYWDENGRFHDLGSLGHYAEAKSINVLGEIVGDSMIACDKDQGITRRATLWRKGEIIDIGVPPGLTHSYANAINDLGQIAVVAYPGGSCDIFLYAQMAQAFLYDQITQSWVNLHTSPQHQGSIPYSINNYGQVIGGMFVFGGGTVPFLWEKGQMYALRPLIVEGIPPSNWGLGVRHINDLGVIAGFAQYRESIPGGGYQVVERPFVLLPIE